MATAFLTHVMTTKLEAIAPERCLSPKETVEMRKTLVKETGKTISMPIPDPETRKVTITIHGSLGADPEKVEGALEEIRRKLAKLGFESVQTV